MAEVEAMLDTYSSIMPNGCPITRNDLVRMEGQEAARRGSPPHDNPDRRSRADGRPGARVTTVGQPLEPLEAPMANGRFVWRPRDVVRELVLVPYFAVLATPIAWAVWVMGVAGNATSEEIEASWWFNGYLAVILFVLLIALPPT